MSEIKDVTLEFGNFQGSNMFGNTNNIQITFKTVFAESEAGQNYRVRIDLYEVRDEEADGLPVYRPTLPFLTFKYGFGIFSKDYYLLTASEGESLQTINYFVNEAKLDTNPYSDSDQFNNIIKRPEFFKAVVTVSPDVSSVSASSAVAKHF